MKEEIIAYLTATYHPLAILLYGSFADGTNNAHSDFDALVIYEGEQGNDSTIFGETPLDVWLYPPQTFASDYDPEEFVQAADGVILMDTDGMAERLQQRVREYLAALPGKSEAELTQELAWCEKMLARTERTDAEGLYRWHWLLMDTLEIYCDLTHRRYLGPKKALRTMQQSDPAAFALYERALREFTAESLAEWISQLKSLH